MCITYMMEVEQRASEGAYSMGGKRDMNFQTRLFPDEILVMYGPKELILLARRYPEKTPSLMLKLHKCITYMMEVEQRASEGAYSMGGKRDMNFQASLFP